MLVLLARRRAAQITDAAERRAAEVTFFFTPRALAVIRVWALTQQLSVYAIEFINALLRLLDNTGKAQHFSTKAGKVYAREVVTAHERSFGCPFDDGLRDLVESRDSVLVIAAVGLLAPPGQADDCAFKSSLGVIVKEDADAPTHIRAFRTLFCQGEQGCSGWW